MAVKLHQNAWELLAEFNTINYISALLGAMSLITVIFQGTEVDEDNLSLLAATSFLVGATVSSTMELVVATLLSFAFQDRFGKDFDSSTGETPILLWAPGVMTCLAAAQFVAGLILWKASLSPTWCTVFYVAVLFVLLWLAMAAAVSVWRKSRKTGSRG